MVQGEVCGGGGGGGRLKGAGYVRNGNNEG